MKLIKDECINGFKLSLENARSFIEDSKLLLDRSKYGHSLGLSMLAIKECGKAIFLLAVNKGITSLDKELSKFIFKDHIAKITMALYDLALFENFPKDEIDYVESLAPKLDFLKQRGFYVDYFEKWLTPQDDNLKEIAIFNHDYAERIYNSVLLYSFV